MGGTVALVSILFLPIVGCGGDNATGLQVIQSTNIPGNIKVFVALAAFAALLCIFLWHHIAAIAASIGGFVSLLIAYNLGHSKLEGIEMKAGAYLAMLGFAVTVIVNFLKLDDKPGKTEEK